MSNLTSRVGAMESSLETLNTDVTEIKTDVNQNKSRIDNVLQTQTQQNDEIKAVRDITNSSKTRFDRIDDSINGINSTLISNKNTLKSLDG